MSNHKNRDIAVIGMSGRFPGADTLADFWQNLINGYETIQTFDQNDLKKSGLPPELLKNPHFVPRRGILNQVEYFDADFFSCSPREAELLDPQHRILLECAWNAFEDAGYDPKRCQAQVGVYVRCNQNTYQFFHVIHSEEMLSHVHALAIYADKDFLATRISHKLNLKGPSLTLQCACSTSLVCVHVACQALLARECDMALAGGVSIVFPQIGYLYQPGGVFSPDGHCRAFDKKAEGTLGGDGAGMVLLKRYADALADKDHIYAIIKGTAVNNDGADKASYAAPSIDGQQRVIFEALEIADVDLSRLAYIETHGTGTLVGDAVEITALSRALAAKKLLKDPIYLGSLKPNIGHLDQAAGIANFIKAVLVAKHALIPPTLHFESPHPELDFHQTPFIVNNTLRELPQSPLPCVGVSSFGFGGTNAHVIIEKFPDEKKYPTINELQIIPISARSDEALEKTIQQLCVFLEKNPSASLSDIAYVLQVGRTAFAKRCFCVVNSVPDLYDKLVTRDLIKDVIDNLSKTIFEDESEALLYEMGKLWCKGVDVKWEKIYEHKNSKRIPLPTYPFEKKYFFIPPRQFGMNDSKSAEASVEFNDTSNNQYERPNLTTAYKTPESSVDVLLADIWQKALGIHRIGVMDDFFQLGGHSLNAIQIVSLIKEHFPIDLQIVDILERPTIEKLSIFIIEKLLSKVETLSDDEAKILLESVA